ncbi:GntR family transcriptional regulator [Aquincola sp. MAHUQ-54]|uniref:GntR family transcriptional regulator n=1 Tax=Aquincola agrisoli TaxID=3119538 RepID=A0AAW9QMA7_9BURK
MAFTDTPDIAQDASTITHSSLATKVYESLRSSLANGELAPDQKLNGRMVAERLGVSQTPVREAMLQLVAERALTMNRNKSVTVPALTAEKFTELRDIRVALETLACHGAVAHITDADIDAIEALHRRMIEAKKAGDYRTTMRLNREVHLGIYRASQRTELVALIESLWVRTGPYLNLLYQNEGRVVVEPHEHERLIAALRARDAEAAAASITRDIVKGGAPVVDALQAAAAK